MQKEQIPSKKEIINGEIERVQEMLEKILSKCNDGSGNSSQEENKYNGAANKKMEIDQLALSVFHRYRAKPKIINKVYAMLGKLEWLNVILYRRFKP